ncbi:MAG: hypothetical protein ACI4UN_08630 [Muribaculaceae bacterium]
MKRIFLCAFALGCFAVSNAQDFRTDQLEQQEPVDTTATVVEPVNQVPENTYSELDSHQQAVNVLQTQLDTRNRKDKLNSIWEKRSTFFNIGYIEEKLNNQDQPDWTEMKSKYGAFISIGHTYYIPRNPIFGLIRFGIDATWFDVSYTFFDKEECTQEKGIKGQLKEYIDYSGNKISLTDKFTEPIYESMEFGHHVAVGMGVGPSITINPVGALKIAGYFHVLPSYHGFLVKTNKLESVWESNDGVYKKQQDKNTEVLHGFVLQTKFGASIAFKAISLGFESRTGSGDMRYEETDKIVMGTDDKSEKIKNKFKMQSTRFFLGFRF